MPLTVFNTLSGRKELFEPVTPGKIGMYVCGVTVYDECHLGHARCYVSFDVIRRYFEYAGFAVHHVQNFTDVDDKIINRAGEAGIPPFDLARKYEQRYFEVFERLNVRRAHVYPRATEEIDGMIRMITTLIERGHAYAADGDVYFSTKTFKDYGKLSKRPEESLLAGARVEVSDKKRDPLDFALWKKAKTGEPSWPSPWGEGRPGWHIECSVMSQKYVGDTLDVHGGGQDLIFPHHENEIAQSEAATGKPFVKYFLHNGFVTVDGEKMSKSLGNFQTLEELYAQVAPDVLRFLIVSAHYRTPLTFTAKKLDDAAAGLARFREGFRHLEELFAFPVSNDAVSPESLDAIRLGSVKSKFENAMNDDFNTAEAIGVLFHALTEVNRLHGAASRSGKAPAGVTEILRPLKSWLGTALNDILGISPAAQALSTDETSRVEELLAGREKARKEKKFSDADRIRDELAAMGYQLQDTPQGPRAVRKR